MFGAVADAGDTYAFPPHVFVYAAAPHNGFYSQVFPCASLALSHGACCFHWMSQGPARLDDGCMLPLYSSNPDIVAAALGRAKADWRAVLRHRAAETRPGGRFVASLISIPAQPGDPFPPGSLESVRIDRLWALIIK